MQLASTTWGGAGLPETQSRCVGKNHADALREGQRSVANENGRVLRPGHLKLTTTHIYRICGDSPSPRPSPRKSGAREGIALYPAFFSGAPAAFFFSIARFSSSARGDSSVAFAFSKNASRPPR